MKFTDANLKKRGWRKMKEKDAVQSGCTHIKSLGKGCKVALQVYDRDYASIRCYWGPFGAIAVIGMPFCNFTELSAYMRKWSKK